MAISKIRKYDESFEKYVGEFLDRYFYPCFEAEFKRNQIDSLQWKGIDVITTNTDGEKSNIDEKSAAHYVNSDLRTFAFEVSFLNRGNSLNMGWLLNKELKTDYYLLSWVYANEQKFPYRQQEMQPNGYPKTVITDYFKYLTTEDITAMDIVVIEKEVVRNSIDLSDEEIMDISTSMREKQLRFKSHKGYKFVLSLGLSEQPVNILLDKSDLGRIGNAYTATKTGVEEGFRQ